MSSSLAIVQKFFPDVEKVVDARKPIDIEVTPPDVASSKVRNHKTCALAVACKRKMHLDGVVISRAVAYLVKDDVATRYLVPEMVTREIVAFDRGGKFEPGTYKLYQPHEAIKLNRERKAPNGPRNKKRQAPHRLTANIRSVLGAEEGGR